ncbi:desmoplakin-B isoform X2 [Mastacembelus armatus]|uniref:desmoplakin-B isoform X2 n=1 Tax=Mastacembelus armatus TaxID=205130 RepID=UPI000E4642B7|nr:desmoplakin-like isoform X2 [Mastacembelus armatus]
MSMYGSQPALNMSRKSGSKGDLTGWGTYHFERSDGQHGGGNGYDPYMEGYKTISYSKSYSGGGTAGGMGGGMASGMGGGMMSGMGGGMASGMGGGMGSSLSAVHQKAMALQVQCQEYLKKAEYTLQNGGSPSEVERYMAMAKENMEQLKSCAMELRQMGQSNENVVRTLEVCKDQLKGVHMAYTGTLQRKRSTRGSSGGWEEPGRSFSDAIAWIAQQKRLVETASWGDDPAAIEQQLINHQKFHSSIQRSPEVDRAKDDLAKKGDKANLHVLEQEWDNLQQLSFGRAQQLRDLQQIIQQISTAIMWVNDREEEELVFDWGDKNIDQYIPKKQESYSKLMSALEDKEKDLNKLKAKVDVLLKNNHPASDKIEAYQDTLQTQWSWLLQITKCIDIHLKENAAYSQFFKEANETYSTLQKEHETIRKKFTCDKNTSLENLLELLRGLEREREKIMENKRQVQHLVNKSKSIVRLKPRNPEEKSSSPVIVKALCDFKQDQKVICKDNEAILKDNSQRSKWDVTGPGGLDMLVPSVCLIVPPPNPLSVSLAKKNEQYYEAILAIWNQLYINVKSLIAWQYCLLDIKHINSLTMTMLAKMRPEDYRQIFKNLENHFEEFKLSCHNSQMFDDEDKRRMETQVSGAQTHYEQLVVQLPTYIVQQEQIEAQQAAEQQQHLIIIQQQQHQQQAAAEAEARRLEEQVRRMEEERQRAEMQKAAERKIEAKKEVVTKEQTIRKETVKGVRDERKKQGSSSTSSSIPSSYSSSRSLSELHALRLRLEGFESLLSQHVHICFGDDGVKDCGLMITQLETAQRDINSMREEYLRLRERILKELEGINDPDKAEFLRSEIEVINKRLGSLESISSAYLQRLQALRDMLQSIAQVEDIVKVHEARLTEKETTSLSTSEVQDYVSTLKSIKAELELKKNVLASMETQLANVSHWNSQVGGPYYRCDMMLSKYTEQVGLLSDRWKRIQGQIDTRLQDLQLYLPQLQHYTQTSTSLTDWIDATRKKQDSLQNTKIETVQALNDHINKQKALNTEIKAKRETVDSVLKDNDSCVRSVKDYETDLASYTSGLETLLNIPIKRTMLKSPTMDLNQEATQLQTRYMELFTLSGDYYKFLGELLKSMEELKIRNTRIDLLEEELRLLRENVQDHSSKNKSLEDALARYQLQLSQSQEQLLSIEEVKRNTAMQCSATKDSLNTTQSQLSDLNDQVGRLNYLLEEEKRKRRLAEERYTHQQEEYELVLRKRQKELETVSWSKLEVEKSVATKDQELEQLRRQLADEAAKAKELQKELSKVRSQCDVEINNIKLSYESQIHVSRTDMQRLAAQRDEDTTELKLQYDRMEADRRNLEEECRRLRMSISQTEEQRKKAEEEAHSQRVVITEEGRRRRELENRMDELMRQREQESSQHKEELAEAMRTLQEKAEKLAYVNHSLEEETRRRKIIEEGQGVLEQSMAQLQVKLTNSSVAATQLGEYEEELKKLRLELERESRERSRLEQNMSSLQGRIKDLQTVRDGLESQVEDLRKGCQEEIARRRQVETELEKSTTTLSEYTSTITTLRQSHEQASTSEKRGEEERLRLQEELEKSLRQNKASAERITQLSAELKALQQQLLQEHARVKEANLRNEGLYRTLEEKTKALNENSAELLRQKEMTETLSKERLKLEEEVRTARHENEELVRSKQGSNDELSSQITALELQLKASERSNVDYRNLVSELSSEREKLKLETEKIQKQASETTAMMQSIQSEYSDIVKERDALLLKLQLSENGKDRLKMLEDELGRIKLSLDSELRNKQRLQEENDRVKRDLSYWKDQYDSKQSLIRQYDTDKEYLEREKNALKSEIERLMRELRELEETYKSRLSTIQKEMHEMTTTRIITETELRRTRESSTLDASTLIFDGVRKPVTANQLLDCGVLDKPTFSQLVNGQKTVPEVSVDKKVNLKGTGPIAGVVVGSQGKMSLSEAKKQMLLPDDSANLLLEAQAATGHIIDPRNNQKLTVEEACARGVVDIKDRDRLLAAEAAAVGYKHPSASKPLSVFEAMQKGLIDKRIGVRLLQAQESVGGILDPNLSVFLPKDVAIKHNILDENFCYVLNQNPTCYLDPDTENDTSYEALKRRCKLEPHTGLLLLPITERQDPSKLIFDGVRKTVTAQQLLDCGVLDKPTFNQLIRGEKTVPDVSVDKKVFLKGTGSIAGVAAGPLEKLSFTDAKNQKIMSPDSTDMLLVAQAATGHIIDPRTNQKLTVEEACAKGVVNKEDESKLFAAEAAAVGYKDRNTGNLLSVGQAMNKGLIDKNTALRFLQAQESLGGILDPILSVFLPKDIAKQRNLIDEDLYQALNRCPECYVDPDTQQPTTYISLKRKCKTEPSTGLLLLPEPKMPLTVRGLRGEVSVIDLVDANLLKQSDVDQVNQGRLTRQDIEDRLRSYLRGSTCIAGVYDEANDKVIPIYQAMKDGLLRRGTTLELLEAQAASGFMVDPINNLYLTVSDAYSKNLFGPEFKDSLLAAESAVTGYKTPGTNKIISLFQAMEKGLIEKGHGIRLLQAQIASGGIIDPEHSHRIDVNVAYKRGYFNEAINKILTDEGDETKGFFDPNTDENLTYLQLKKRCITDKKTGLILLPIMNKKKQESTQKNTTRKRRVLIVDPETNREMTVREAYDKKFIDYDTYLELSQQECEWDEITITAPDGSVKFVIIDRKTGRQYDISELLEKKVIDQSVLDKYRSHVITLTEFADIITNKTTHGSFSSSTARPMASSSTSSSSTSRKSETSSASSSVLPRPLSPSLAKMTTTRTTTVTERSSTISSVSQDLPGSLKHISSVSVNLPSQEPVGAIFDTENVEKISITEALNRGLVDAITAQRLLEAQACTGGIINPANGRRLSIQEASRLGIINDEMATKLKPAQKAYLGFEDVKTKKKMSVAQAMKEMWVPYEAGQRFMEFQFVTGGLYDPEMECRRTLEDALKMGWLDERAALKLQDIKSHAKNLTCPKSKLKISYKEALDNSLVEESTGVRMLQASSVSSRGISSPYNVSSAPGSTTGSRSGSRQGSRRSSVDLSSPSSSLTGHYSYSFTSFSSTR